MFLTTHLAPNIMIGPAIVSDVGPLILNPNILRKNIALRMLLAWQHAMMGKYLSSRVSLRHTIVLLCSPKASS